MDKLKFKIIGGDLRQITIANTLANEGHTVSVSAFDKKWKNKFCEKIKFSEIEKTKKSEVIILPLPMTRDNKIINAPLCTKEKTIKSIIDRLSEQQIVFAGKIDEKISKMFEKNKIKIVDYYKDEELNIENAVPAAEGAIAIAITETPITLQGSNCLITGYGRIGRILAERLSGFHLNLTVVSDNPIGKTWSETYGHHTINVKELKKYMSETDIIFNTIPNIILTKNILKKMKKTAIIVEIASEPGGVDLKSAKDFGIKVIPAPSLPGRFAPINAGIIIKNTIFKTLSKLKLEK